MSEAKRVGGIVLRKKCDCCGTPMGAVETERGAILTCPCCGKELKFFHNREDARPSQVAA